MERHLLVTVSEDKNALYGMRFVGHVFSNKEQIKLTLLYVAPRPPAVWEGERTLDTERHSEQKRKEILEKGRRALEEAKKELARLGFRPEQIGTKLQVRKISKVTDIISEAAEGLYDALVLGRRGLSRLEEAFDESTSRKIIEVKVNFPIWICRRPDVGRKNILLCVDGSDAAYRAVDHVGLILGQEQRQEITIFIVKKKGAISSEDTEHIFSKSREYLTEHAFPAELTKTKVIEAGNVAKTILKEAGQGKYAAVAVGRTGADQGLMKSIFMGSVSDTLFRELEKTSLWICQ